MVIFNMVRSLEANVIERDTPFVNSNSLLIHSRRMALGVWYARGYTIGPKGLGVSMD